MYRENDLNQRLRDAAADLAHAKEALLHAALAAADSMLVYPELRDAASEYRRCETIYDTLACIR